MTRRRAWSIQALMWAFSWVVLSALLTWFGTASAQELPPIVEDCNAPLSAATWPAEFGGGATDFDVSGGLCVSSTGSYTTAYYDVQDFGPDTEVCFTIDSTTNCGSCRAYMRVHNEGTANAGGYAIRFRRGGNEIQYVKLVNNANTTLFTESFTYPAGNVRVCARVVASDLCARVETGGFGSEIWDERPCQTDASPTGGYLLAGKVGIAISAGKIDDIRAGNHSCANLPRLTIPSAYID